MSGIVITITSGKGGVGKTTTVANLAAALSLLGHRVIAVDADIGLRNLDIILGLESRILYDVVDVAEQRCSLQQALVRDERAPSLQLLPAAQIREKSDISPQQMAMICQELRKMADYILIDSPAGIEHGFRNAIAPADRILVVTTPDVSALRDADKVIYLLERDWRQHPWLILNRYNAKMVQNGDMRNIDDVLDILAVDLLGVIPEDSEIVLSTDRGLPAVYNKNLWSNMAYFNVARRIMGESVPLMNFRKPTLFGPLGRIFSR